MLASVLSELRILSSGKFDAETYLTVVLAGDTRLADRFRHPELLPIGSRIRTRLLLDYASQDELRDILRHALKKAGAPKLLTEGLQDVLVDHAAGNYRVLMTMAGELLMAACERELPAIDEKLYLEFVDTLSKAMGALGLDENSASDTNAFLAGANRVAAEIGCCVVLFHHPGKDPTKGGRGSSALFAGVDLSYELTTEGETETGKVLKLRQTKNKDGPLLEDIFLTLKAAHGSCILAHSGREPPPPATDTLKALGSLGLRPDSLIGATRAEWLEAAKGTPKSTLNRHIRHLYDNGFVKKTSGREAFVPTEAGMACMGPTHPGSPVTQRLTLSPELGSLTPPSLEGGSRAEREPESGRGNPPSRSSGPQGRLPQGEAGPQTVSEKILPGEGVP